MNELLRKYPQCLYEAEDSASLAERHPAPTAGTKRSSRHHVSLVGGFRKDPQRFFQQIVGCQFHIRRCETQNARRHANSVSALQHRTRLHIAVQIRRHENSLMARQRPYRPMDKHDSRSSKARLSLRLIRYNHPAQRVHHFFHPPPHPVSRRPASRRQVCPQLRLPKQRYRTPRRHPSRLALAETTKSHA